VFAAHQIVCLECGQTHLYGEVIQVIETRQLCWVRPIMLVYSEPSLVEITSYQIASHEPGNIKGIEPLTDGPDLLWPVNQFRPAMDVDVLPFLVAVENDKSATVNSRQRKNELLRQFIDKVWTGKSGVG
jgi:hypothetical protein